MARVRSQAFSDAACQRSLRALVALINEAPRLSPEVLATRADATSIYFADDVSDPILDYPTLHPTERSDLIRGWSVAGGKQDAKPIRLVEVNHLKADKGIALYQFTLERQQCHPADDEGCNGLFTHRDFYGPERRSYLGEFVNNRLRDVSAFDAWLRVM